MKRHTTARRIATIAFLLAAPLITLELGVRLLILTDRLPVAAAHTPEFEITWENLSKLGTADVLILGDSVSQQGIEPAELERLLRPERGEVTVFNAASGGAGVGVSWSIVQQLAREDRLPRVVLLGIQPGSVRNDSNFREKFGLTPMGSLFSDCERVSGYEDRLDCGFAAISAAWRWRGHLDRVLGALQRTVPSQITSGGLRLRKDGFREGRGVSMTRLSEQLDGANLKIRLIQVSEDMVNGYVRLMDRLRAEGVTVVPIAIPESKPLRDRMELRQPGRRQLFRDALDRLEQLTGVTFVDPVVFGAWYGDGQARNFNHLSVDGATNFTRQLWAMPDFHDRLLAGLDATPD
jgi:hypothetical protein